MAIMYILMNFNKAIHTSLQNIFIIFSCVYIGGILVYGWHGGLMVSALDSRSGGLGSSSGEG